MTFSEFKVTVQSLWPVVFSEALITTEIDSILETSIRKALSKYEKIENIEVAGSTSLPQASAILVCVPVSEGSGSSYSVMDFAFKGTPGERRHSKGLNFRFGPDRMLLIQSEQAAYVEYVLDTSYALTVNSSAIQSLGCPALNNEYFMWAAEYSEALLSIKEGTTGLTAVLTSLPFEFNYQLMHDDGIAKQERLTEELEEKYFGLFGGKS